jgi:hypothetical protein
MDKECCEILYNLLTKACYNEFHLAEDAEDLWGLAASIIWIVDNDEDGKRVFARKLECIKCKAKECTIEQTIEVAEETVSEVTGNPIKEDCKMTTFVSAEIADIVNCNMRAYVN